jgi:uncharacterized iron-regulated membrane protein
MAKSFQYKIRRIHRYLGLILGIQFLLWTAGGIYFSWSNMDEIHGDLQRKPISLISSNFDFISPATVIKHLKNQQQVDSIETLVLIEIMGKPYYQVHYKGSSKPDLNHQNHHPNMTSKVILADAITGEVHNPINKSEAVKIAERRFNEPAAVKNVELLTKTSSHHEYRESPLPAYAITFDHPTSTTVYVSTELGTVQKFRNEKWRIFDFLWMMHTMDYNGRDNFGNLLLKAFSVFGLVTILSGFVLYYVSSRSVKNLRRKFIG